MALRARIYAYNRHLSFDVAFICSTLTYCGVCDLSAWRLKWEVSYVHQSVWRWKWFSCQSSYVLQRLRLCRTSDTVYRREIDSRRQWGYGVIVVIVVIVSPLRRSVSRRLLTENRGSDMHSFMMIIIYVAIITCCQAKQTTFVHGLFQQTLLTHIVLHIHWMLTENRWPG